ncbi:hypothetical protein [Streptomyces pacificus]|uniref:hypothetical protein n=1 Tax=Streptomyces pacificus TaxID=2705029 RepID=UPI0015635F34|nr:hypothetical protein [Streptomyces pacificus]
MARQFEERGRHQGGEQATTGEEGQEAAIDQVGFVADLQHHQLDQASCVEQDAQSRRLAPGQAGPLV